MVRLLSALVVAWLAGLAPGCAPAAGRFHHGDWELACDNTRTCRAAGYHRDDEEPQVSVLLTRAAGASQAVAGQVQLGTYDDRLVLPQQVALVIDGRSLGDIALVKGLGRGDLSAGQTDALLQAVVGTGDVRFVSEGHRWHLSGAGASAVLLRMDELQGRIGTAGALVRKGQGDESHVLPPLARPVVHAAALAGGTQPRPEIAIAVLRSLQPPPDDCPEPLDSGEAPRIWRLAENQVLVQARCWMQGFNVGYGFWVASERPPHRPVAVTLSGSAFDAASGILVAAQKARGLGDCMERLQWVWDGARFVRTGSSTTGQCRMVTAGGPWSLPTLVTEIVPAPRRQGTTEEEKK
jgi:hypothetical protein